jgi:hypothetical protein
MKKPAMVVLTAALMAAATARAASRDDGREPPAAPAAMDRARVSADIVARWSAGLEDGGDELRGALAELSVEALAGAARAETLKDLTTAVYGDPGPVALGDLDLDLVFTPVTPCRLADTRSFATGPSPFGGGSAFPFSVNNLLEAQGGSSAGCGVPNADPDAVAVTFTAVAPEQGPVRFRIHRPGPLPPDATPPEASIVVNSGLPGSGLNLANTTIVPLDRGSGPYEFAVQSLLNPAHLVIDVVGYFRAPERTALACETVSRNEIVPELALWTFESPACPANTTLTSGGIDLDLSGHPDVRSYRSVPNVSRTRWTCTVKNRQFVKLAVQCSARCCQTPGR